MLAPRFPMARIGLVRAFDSVVANVRKQRQSSLQEVMDRAADLGGWALGCNHERVSSSRPRS